MKITFAMPPYSFRNENPPMWFTVSNHRCILWLNFKFGKPQYREVMPVKVMSVNTAYRFNPVR